MKLVISMLLKRKIYHSFFKFLFFKYSQLLILHPGLLKFPNPNWLDIIKSLHYASLLRQFLLHFLSLYHFFPFLTLILLSLLINVTMYNNGFNHTSENGDNRQHYFRIIICRLDWYFLG